MKKLVLLFVVLSLLACSNTEKKVAEIKESKENYAEYQFGEKDLLKSYVILGEEIVFKIDFDFNGEEIYKALPDESTISKISLTGSFTGWKEKEGFEMIKDENQWYLKKNLKDLMIPGNSGYPEFAFYIEGEYLKKGRKRPTEGYVKPSEKLEIGYKFSDQFTGHNNFLIVSENEDLERIKTDHQRAITIKKVYELEEDMANFRNVQVGDIKEKRFYRSYHPFIPSKDYDKEIKRNEKVEELLEKNQIKSIINLSEGEEIHTDERVPAYYKELLDSGNVLLETTKYRIVYYQSDSEGFAKTLNRVSKFIIEKEAPFLVHCRLGTDRTGVSSAFIEALMGATWQELVEDYQKSNRVGMEEFRHENLLKYSFTNALKEDPSKIEDLQGRVKAFFIKEVGLSEEEIDKIYKKLAM